MFSRFFDGFSGSLPATQLLVIFTMSPFKGQTGLKRILNASGYSMAGLRAAFTGEAAFRQLVLLNVVLIPLTFLFSVSRVERALMIAVCLLALIVELLNSAIEAAIDRISLDLHPLSKNAKDMGSAAQFVALSLIACVWAVILL
jgi:diacylglycerol kinase (ATP)